MLIIIIISNKCKNYKIFFQKLKTKSKKNYYAIRYYVNIARNERNRRKTNSLP